MFKFKGQEEAEFKKLLAEFHDHEKIREMENYPAHGVVSTYHHSVRVAAVSFMINRRYHLRADERSLVRGAMLHDFYLYDWHKKEGRKLRDLHGFSHPVSALQNAREHFRLNRREENIIRSHMWPLTLLHVPSCREAVIVCIADKICSGQETLFYRKKSPEGPCREDYQPGAEKCPDEGEK